MLTHLKIIWQFHAHPVHQKVSRFFGSRYIGEDFFLGPNITNMLSIKHSSTLMISVSENVLVESEWFSTK